MQVHDFVLVAEFLRQLEEEAILEGSILRALLGLSLRFFVLSQCIKTGRFEKVDLRVKVVPLDQFIVYIHRSLVVTIVESCVGDSHVGLAVVAVAVLTVALE